MATEKLISIRLGVEGTEKVKELLRSMGAEGEKALRNIERATTPPSKSLQALNEIMVPLRGRFQELAGQAGAVGNALSVFGGAGTAAAVVVGGMVAAFTAGTRALLEAEKADKRLNASLQVTGYTSGLTGTQITEFAGKFARAMGIQDEAIKASAATLTSFRSVSGDVFTGTLKQAANLSAMYGGDLDSNVQALGKTMEMLAGGQAEGLRKAFKSLTVAQEDHIRVLAESGRGIEAQRELLKSLEITLGDFAEKSASGLSKISIAWDDLLKHIGNTEPVKEALKFVLDKLKTTNDMFEWFSNNSVRKLTALEVERFSLVKAISDEQATFGEDSFVLNAKGRLEVINKEIKALQDLVQARVDAESADQKRAKEAASQQQRDNKLNTFMQKLKKENEESVKESEAAAKRMADERARATQSIQDQIKALQDESTGLKMSDRARAVHTEIIKAENEARRGGFALPTKLREGVIKGAETKYDNNQAIEDAKKAQAKLEKEAEKQLREFERAVDHTTDKISDAFVDAFEGSKTAAESFRDFYMQMMKEIVANSVIRPIISPIVEGVMGGIGGGGNNAGSGIFNGISTVLSSFFHDGGIVGGETQQRAIAATAFTNAPRYHGGGIAGLKSDEVPAILQRGEVVLPRNMGKSSAPSVTSQKFEFNVTVSGPAASSPQAAASAGNAFAVAAKAKIIEIIQNEKRPGGSLYGVA